VYSSAFSWFIGEAFEVGSFSKIKNDTYLEASGGSWRIRVAGWRKKTKNSPKQRGTGEDEEAKAGGPTSMAARKTTVQRDCGESLSS